ncbi:arsenate reductase family protein [Kribbella koreensis]|uniref:Arsenate reductase family protein n=1 Tax=Kribbella koreensis TaxID=57909 RepID=A0ABN1R003_9ACTN
MEIWINPACSKCQAATTALDEAGATYTVRRYLDDPPTAEELEAVLTRLNLAPWHVARMNEPAAEAVAALPMDEAHRPHWIAALIANPILIQRPILTTDNGTTAIARDPETLTRLLGP